MFLFVMAFAVSSFAQKNIIFVCTTDLATGELADEREQPMVDAIMAVDGGTAYTITYQAASYFVADNVDAINAADLVIVGRGVKSGDVLDNRQVFNDVTTPTIQTSPWVVRGDRLAYVTGGTEHQNTDDAKVVSALVQDESHAVFTGVTITEGAMDWTIGYTSDLTAETGGPVGTVLAKTADERVLLTVIDAGTALASGYTPAGMRAYMGNGQDNVEPHNYWNFSDGGKQVFLNLVAYMSGKALSAKDIASAKLNVYGVRGGIKLPSNSNASVYSISGKLLQKGVNEDFISVAKGMYIVRSGNASAKVMVIE